MHKTRPPGIIRQLRPSELPQFREHLLRLDPASRRDRFRQLAELLGRLQPPL